MLLAVLAGTRAEAETLCARIRNGHSSVEPIPFFEREAFFRAVLSGTYAGAVIALGDSDGFLAARRLRELDRNVHILIIDDSERYALQCIRIHAVDFIIRPMSDDRLKRGIDLLLG